MTYIADKIREPYREDNSPRGECPKCSGTMYYNRRIGNNECGICGYVPGAW